MDIRQFIGNDDIDATTEALANFLDEARDLFDNDRDNEVIIKLIKDLMHHTALYHHLAHEDSCSEDQLKFLVHTDIVRTICAIIKHFGPRYESGEFVNLLRLYTNERKIVEDIERRNSTHEE